MSNRLLRLTIIMACVFLCGFATAADQESSPPDFTHAVIHKAISFMPSDLKTKLTAIESQLTTAPAATEQAKPEPVYFVEADEGTGPQMLAEQFRLVRKGVNDKQSFQDMAPSLRDLARCVIGLSQPYHTDKTAFNEPAHKEFEKQLDSSCATLKAEYDGPQKVDDPGNFAKELAKSANKQFKKISSASDAAGVPSAIYGLAANAVADCWLSLLQTSSPESTSGSSTGKFIGNKQSLKFHLPTCSYLPAEKNRVYFDTREEAIAQGYVPCKRCKP